MLMGITSDAYIIFILNEFKEYLNFINWQFCTLKYICIIKRSLVFVYDTIATLVLQYIYIHDCNNLTIFIKLG